jgi:hypothetical protein
VTISVRTDRRYGVKAVLTHQAFPYDQHHHKVEVNFCPRGITEVSSEQPVEVAILHHSFPHKPLLGGLFSKRHSQSGGEDLHMEFRLPNKATLMPGRRIPFLLLLKRSATFKGTVHVDALEGKLMLTTTYPNESIPGKKNTASREMTIFSKSDMNLHLLPGVDELRIRSNDFTPPIHVPGWVFPAFKICNIVTTYSMTLQVTLRHDKSEHEHVLLTQNVVIDSGFRTEGAPPESPTYEQYLKDRVEKK